MARKIIWTQIAWDDLEDIAEYISRDSANYAAAFVREIRTAARSLEKFSNRGHIVPEVKNPNIRELIIRSYRLIFQVTEKAVFILGLVHGARDLAGLWNLDPTDSPMQRS
jgi:plasmid stabilization system protein ParE